MFKVQFWDDKESRLDDKSFDLFSDLMEFVDSLKGSKVVTSITVNQLI